MKNSAARLFLQRRSAVAMDPDASFFSKEEFFRMLTRVSYGVGNGGMLDGVVLVGTGGGCSVVGRVVQNINVFYINVVVSTDIVREDCVACRGQHRHCEAGHCEAGHCRGDIVDGSCCAPTPVLLHLTHPCLQRSSSTGEHPIQQVHPAWNKVATTSISSFSYTESRAWSPGFIVWCEIRSILGN